MSQQFDPENHPHQRYNPLTDEWMLVSPHRRQRPWQGQVEKVAADDRPAYDPKCYLCPGNTRASKDTNPAYTDTFVFRNDYSALLPDTPLTGGISDELLRSEPVQGECRVICFSPRHDLTLPQMDVEKIRSVVEVWAGQAEELGERYRWVQLFENKGAVMGCSNPHPHGQVWASSFLPRIPAQEDLMQKQYLARNGSRMLTDYAALELQRKERVVEFNEHWVMLVPFWAVWPFEMMLIPRQPVQTIPELTEDQRSALADIMKRSLTKYDNLFQTSFPYSMGWHGAPTGPERPDGSHWQLHAHYYPPLLRGADVRKFMVGYEMMAEPQRDLTAEEAARRIREQPDKHYKE